MAGTELGWYIGVGLGIGSSIVSNLGVNVQKLAHTHREKNLQKQLDLGKSKVQMESINNSSSDNGDNNNNSNSNNTNSEMQLKKDNNNPIDTQKAKEKHDKRTKNGEHQRRISKIIERKASQIHAVIPKQIKPKQNPYLFDPRWVIGLLLQVIGASMDFTALGLAGASVVAPLGSLTLVTNVFLAPVMHHERLTTPTIISTCFIISGTILTVIFSPRTTDVDGTQAVFNLFKQNEFIAYAIPTSGLLIGTFIITRYMAYLKAKKPDKYTPIKYKIHRFCIAMLSGTMGAQNIFFAKMLSTLLVFTIEGEGKSMFYYWITYFVILAVLCTIYFQLKWLNTGLKNFSALHIVPIFQVFWITVSVVGGLTVYQEFKQMKLRDKIVFPVGVIITIIGVALLTSLKKPERYRSDTQINTSDNTSNTPDDDDNMNNDNVEDSTDIVIADVIADVVDGT